MFCNIYLFICLARPLQSSFLSRVKNRYEYIPQEDILNVTEDLYDFDTTRQEKLVSYTLKSVHTTEPDPRDIVYIVPEVGMKNKTSVEFNASTTELDTRDIYLSYDYDVWPHTMPQWRPTVVNTESVDVTWKRRKTFPTHFPTKKNYKTAGTNATITSTSKSRVFPWIANRKGSAKGNLLVVPTVRRRLTTSKYTTGINARRFVITKTIKAKCYWCGLNERGIPRSPSCYATFNSPDHRHRRIPKRYNAICVVVKIKPPEWKFWNWYRFPVPAEGEVWNSGFRTGCFKRFLDVGVVYTERGCRTNRGWEGNSYASIRFSRLERMLSNVEEGCIFSPHASLTPFSRAISLYARYHVCVCKKYYCNHASSRRPGDPCHVLLLLIILSVCFVKCV